MSFCKENKVLEVNEESKLHTSRIIKFSNIFNKLAKNFIYKKYNDKYEAFLVEDENEFFSNFYFNDGYYFDKISEFIVLLHYIIITDSLIDKSKIYQFQNNFVLLLNFLMKNDDYICINENYKLLITLVGIILKSKIYYYSLRIKLFVNKECDNIIMFLIKNKDYTGFNEVLLYCNNLRLKDYKFTINLDYKNIENKSILDYAIENLVPYNTFNVILSEVSEDLINTSPNKYKYQNYLEYFLFTISKLKYDNPRYIKSIIYDFLEKNPTLMKVIDNNCNTLFHILLFLEFSDEIIQFVFDIFNVKFSKEETELFLNFKNIDNESFIQLLNNIKRKRLLNYITKKFKI